MWDDYTKEITFPNPYPTPGSVFGPCKEIDFHCTRATDFDGKGVHTAAGYSWSYLERWMAPLSAGYPYWTCSQGGFLDTREGQDVTWKSPKNATWVSVSVHENDWPTPIPPPAPGDAFPYDVMGTRDDPVRAVDTLSFVVATVELRVDDNPLLKQKDIFVNCDDDNLDGDVDKDEPTSTVNLYENDLTKLAIYALPTDLDTGLITLQINGIDKIRVWEPEGNEKKGTRVTDNYITWDLAQSERPPSVYWIEGYSASGGEWDVEFILRQWHGSKLVDIDKVESTVFDIKKVEWQAVYKPLDANPGIGGGKRIFAALDQPTPPPEPTIPDWENLVRVKAQIDPPLSGRTVYFRCYDVDDPSSNNPVIDDENDGQDNYGTNKTGELRPANSLDPQHIVDYATSSAGWAELDFIVTGRPGDNYRISACLPADKDFFRDIEAEQDRSDGEVVLKGGTRDDVTASYRTEMLTVWRNLWIEFDRMGLPPTSEEFGTVVGTSQDVLEQGKMLGIMPDPGWTAACLNGGVLNPRGTTAPDSVNLFPPGTAFWEVNNNSNNAIEVRWNLRVDPNDPGLPDGFDQDGDSQVDEDDEYDYLPTSGIAPGDFAVNTDDLTWCSFSPSETPPPGFTTHPDYDAVIDSLNGYLAPAYIRAQMAPFSVDVVPFQRHAPHPSLSYLDYEGCAWYWIARVYFAYDSFYRKQTYEHSSCDGGVVYWGDDDPEDEALPDRDWKVSSLGHTTGDGESCLINCETIRDHPPRNALETIAHEVGHALGLNHANYVHGEGWDPDWEGVMGWQPKQTNPAQFPCIRDWFQIIRAHSYPRDRYSNHHIANIRANATD